MSAPPQPGGEPGPSETTDAGSGEIDWLIDVPWGGPALLLVLAIGVVAAAKYLSKSRSRSGPRTGGRAAWRKPDFDLEIAKLDELPITAIADAKAGPIHVRGVLHQGEGALGTGEHACVYQNRVGASRASAIAAELVLLDDGTAMLGLESLEAARVIAPTEDHGPRDTKSLYLGDHVEVVGQLSLFDEPQTAGGRELRGMLGSLGQIQIRVVDRPPHRRLISLTNSETP